MGSPIEHAVGVYIGMLLLVCVVAIAAKRLTHLPYAIFLTLAGLGVGWLNLGPSPAEAGFSHDLIFFVILPPLLFQGGLSTHIQHFRKSLPGILAFAVPGVVASTFLVGGIIWWQGGLPTLAIALLFGALISPTDPVSTLTLLRDTGVPHDLRTLVEGESLFNDGTGVVLFTILLEASLGQHVTVAAGVLEFAQVSIGGLIVGLALGALVALVLARLNDHLLENAICLALAYGSYWLAEVAGVSGVIATVSSGLVIGGYGKRFSMSDKTRDTIETFFASIDFLLTSLLFVLIGLELRAIWPEVPQSSARLVVVAIVAMLAARGLVSYAIGGLFRVTRQHWPRGWSHVLFWGGLRGAIPIALLLHLPSDLPADNPLAQARPALIAAGFACVFFSLVVQGLTMRPLIQGLGLGASGDRTEVRPPLAVG